MNIEVCIGNSCLLKGSYDIMKGFHKLIQQNHLENDVTLSASFCMEDCPNRGVPVKIGESFSDGVSADNLENVFGKYVLNPVCRA